MQHKRLLSMESFGQERPLSLVDDEIVVIRASRDLAIRTSLRSGGSDDTEEECLAAGRHWRGCDNFACDKDSGVCFDEGTGDWDY